MLTKYADCNIMVPQILLRYQSFTKGIIVKNNILNACINEINQKGLHFTMADLAASLAVSKRTLYEAFRSKDLLIAYIIDTTLEEIKIQDADILTNDSYSTIEKIKELMNYQPKTSLILDSQLLVSVKQYYPKEWQKLIGFRESKLSLIESLIKQGIAEKQFCEIDMNIVRVMIRSSVEVFFDKSFLLNTEMTSKQAIGKMTDILFYGLLIR